MIEFTSRNSVAGRLGSPSYRAKSNVGKKIFCEPNAKSTFTEERNFKLGVKSISPNTLPTNRFVVQLSWVCSIWLMGLTMSLSM